MKSTFTSSRFKRQLIVVSIAALLNACAGLEIAGVNVSDTYQSAKTLVSGSKLTPAETKTIGDELGAQLLAIYPPVNNEEQQRYLNRIGGWLQRQGNNHNEQWRFVIVNSEGMNAFSTPSGLIMVTTGLLAVLDSEHEIAAVLAHEIAHVELSHHVQNIERSQKLASVAGLADAVLSGSAGNAGSMLSAGVVDISKDLYGKGMERDDELAADAQAVQLMNKAGYDPYAFVTMLQKIEARYAEQSKLSGFFLTHPKPRDRIDSVAETLDGLHSAAQFSDSNLQQRYTRIFHAGG